MVKYHINDQGQIKTCTATQGNCPFTQHFDSETAAADWIENTIEAAEAVRAKERSRDVDKFNQTITRLMENDSKRFGLVNDLRARQDQEIRNYLEDRDHISYDRFLTLLEFEDFLADREAFEEYKRSKYWVTKNQVRDERKAILSSMAKKAKPPIFTDEEKQILKQANDGEYVYIKKRFYDDNPEDGGLFEYVYERMGDKENETMTRIEEPETVADQVHEHFEKQKNMDETEKLKAALEASHERVMALNDEVYRLKEQQKKDREMFLEKSLNASNEKIDQLEKTLQQYQQDFASIRVKEEELFAKKKASQDWANQLVRTRRQMKENTFIGGPRERLRHFQQRMLKPMYRFFNWCKKIGIKTQVRKGMRASNIKERSFNIKGARVDENGHFTNVYGFYSGYDGDQKQDISIPEKLYYDDKRACFVGVDSGQPYYQKYYKTNLGRKEKMFNRRFVVVVDEMEESGVPYGRNKVFGSFEQDVDPNFSFAGSIFNMI